jgi:hypothetical protein
LVDPQEKIQQAERNEANVNQRRRDERQEARMQNVRRQWVFELPVLKKNLLFEPEFAIGPVVAKIPFPSPPARYGVRFLGPL